MIQKFILICVLVLTQSAHAGIWVFGGADQIGNKYNPWFLESDKRIKYCIKIDESSFSANLAEVEELVELSINYWRLDFIKLQKLAAVGINDKGLNLNEFKKVSCSENPDLRFLFGAGTLNETEKNFLGKYDFLGGSVRTDYDDQLLEGKGFIYIPSDVGPLSKIQVNQVQRPWKVKGLLYRVLVHEMGHVFGLQHSEKGVMMATYPELILKNEAYMGFSDITTLPSTVLPDSKNLDLGKPMHIDNGIRVVKPSVSRPGQTDSYNLIDGVTIEWASVVLNSKGEKIPTLIRKSPFSYDTYQVINNEIKIISLLKLQCRSDICFSDK